MDRVVVAPQNLGPERGQVGHCPRLPAGILTHQGRVTAEALRGQLVPAGEKKLLVAEFIELLDRESGDGALDFLDALLALQEGSQLVLLEAVVALDVALEDGVVVAEAHLPVGVDVVLEDLLLLGVGQHLHCLLRTVQQRRMQEVVGPPPGQLALPLPLLLVALVEVQVPSVPRVLPQIGVGHFGEDS